MIACDRSVTRDAGAPRSAESKILTRSTRRTTEPHGAAFLAWRPRQKPGSRNYYNAFVAIPLSRTATRTLRAAPWFFVCSVLNASFCKATNPHQAGLHDQPPHAILQQPRVEIEQQTKPQATHPQIGQQLRLVRRNDAGHGLDLNNQLPLYQDTHEGQVGSAPRMPAQCGRARAQPARGIPQISARRAGALGLSLSPSGIASRTGVRAPATVAIETQPPNPRPNAGTEQNPPPPAPPARSAASASSAAPHRMTTDGRTRSARARPRPASPARRSACRSPAFPGTRR